MKRSMCHAWSSHVVLDDLSARLGVRPLRPGWTEAEVCPIDLSTDFARGHVCTPLGPLKVHWYRTNSLIQLEVEPPDDMKMFLKPPPGARVVEAGDTRLAWEQPTPQDPRTAHA
jgi:hypothetical protein